MPAIRADAPPVNGVLRFFTDLDDSLMERLQQEFHGIELRASTWVSVAPDEGLA